MKVGVIEFIIGLLLFGVLTMLAGRELGRSQTMHRCKTEIIGANNATSLLLVKVLTQLRDGNTENAFTVMETLLDQNIKLVWESQPDATTTTNILRIIKEYRTRYPAFTQRLQTNGHPVLLERHDFAGRVLQSIQ